MLTRPTITELHTDTIDSEIGPIVIVTRPGAHVVVDTGGTEFQRRVWAELRAIPPGSTRTYGELAARLGGPNASRAVGLANSQNPLSIVVPCHRLVGSDGSLTGYAGGLARKQWLLRHEGAIL